MSASEVLTVLAAVVFVLLMAVGGALLVRNPPVPLPPESELPRRLAQFSRDLNGFAEKLGQELLPVFQRATEQLAVRAVPCRGGPVTEPTRTGETRAGHKCSFVARDERDWAEHVNSCTGDARTLYAIGGGWGNHVSFMDRAEVLGLPDGTTSKRWRVYGHKRRRPVVGDVLLAQMESGRRGRFTFTDVEYQRDPEDMFFAWVEWDGYDEPLASARTSTHTKEAE